MANSLSNLGEQYMLEGNGGGDGSFARLAAKVKLYDSTSVPSKGGGGFVEVANGNGYTTGGQAISLVDFTFSVVVNNGQIQMDDKVFTAAGGPISNIAGAYITDAADNVLAWWERTPFTLQDTETLTLDDLTIRL